MGPKKSKSDVKTMEVEWNDQSVGRNFKLKYFQTEN